MEWGEEKKKGKVGREILMAEGKGGLVLHIWFQTWSNNELMGTWLRRRKLGRHTETLMEDFRENPGIDGWKGKMDSWHGENGGRTGMGEGKNEGNPDMRKEWMRTVQG